jgi:hypothetical protein
MLKRNFLSSILISILAYSSFSIAGGPLILEGPAGNTPVTYRDPNIQLHVETGDLSTSISNTEANLLLQQAFDLWNKVNTSTLNLNIDTTAINEDINIDNYQDYLPYGSEYHEDDNLNPVVYDEDGRIIDAFFYSTASNDIVGFAASILTVGSSYFDEGFAVVSNKLNLTDTELKLLIAHEIGHFFGIDHTQVDINPQETDTGTPVICTTTQAENYPLMYPFICRDIETLHQDDISALSALYPSADINDNFGILQGRLVDENNTAVLGANIWAKNTVTGDSVSIVSDYLAQGTGFYKLYLPAGSYTLHVNSLNTLFNGGSGIGPYSSDIFDVSFQAPHPIAESTYQGDTAGSDEIITIVPNQTRVIDFAINGQAAVISQEAVEDDSITDLFGATSHMTLLLLLSLLSGHRLAYRLRRKD